MFLFLHGNRGVGDPFFHQLGTCGGKSKIRLNEASVSDELIGASSPRPSKGEEWQATRSKKRGAASASANCKVTKAER